MAVGAPGRLLRMGRPLAAVLQLVIGVKRAGAGVCRSSVGPTMPVGSMGLTFRSSGVWELSQKLMWTEFPPFSWSAQRSSRGSTASMRGRRVLGARDRGRFLPPLGLVTEFLRRDIDPAKGESSL